MHYDSTILRIVGSLLIGTSLKAFRKTKLRYVWWLIGPCLRPQLHAAAFILKSFVVSTTEGDQNGKGSVSLSSSLDLGIPVINAVAGRPLRIMSVTLKRTRFSREVDPTGFVKETLRTQN